MKNTWVWLMLYAALLSGCGLAVPSRAVEQLRPVETIGYDTDGTSVTMSASSGADLPAAVAARGGSIPQAMENLRGWSDAQELFFAHVRYVVAGEPASRAGLGELLDWFARSTQTTLETPLLVARDANARDLVTAPGGPDREITALLASMQRDAEQTGAARCFTLREVIRRLNRSGAALCCSVESRFTRNNVPADQDAPAVLCSGYAVLKNASLIGFLNTEAALGADLIMNTAGRADYVLPCGEGSAAVTLLESKTKLIPAWDTDGEPILLVVTRLRAGILSVDGVDTADPGVRRSLADALARAVAIQEVAALTASRDMDADFLELRRAAAKTALDAEVDGLFLRNLRWRVQPEAVIERSYDLDGSMSHG